MSGMESDGGRDRAVQVAIRREAAAEYPSAPFDPAEDYPELPCRGRRSAGNRVYAMVRGVLRDLGLDAGRYGTAEWNPLGELIEPGQTVVVKPNLVLDRHPRGEDPVCLVTHGSVVRAVLDYVMKALRGRGKVIVADAPIQETDFAGAVRLAGIDKVLEFFGDEAGMEVELIDLRKVQALKDRRGHVREWRELSGDPEGYADIDLGAESFLAPLESRAARFRVANYPVEEILKCHRPGFHRYVISRSVLGADVIVSLPKMKTHCKAGVTLGLKNFVGIVGRKECLAHHRAGSPRRGGDEYPHASVLKALSRMLEEWIDGCPHVILRTFLEQVYRANERVLKIVGADPLRDGSWYGNDTVWRMVLDLNRIVRYGRADGGLADRVQRRIFTLVDGVIAGEGDGPLEPVPRHAGIIAAGEDAATLDAALALVMGFDWEKVPQLRHVFEAGGRGITRGGDVWRREVVLNGERMSLRALGERGVIEPFEAPPGWKGHLEKEGSFRGKES